MRIFTISDLHVDYSESAEWVANLSTSEYTNDVLILAGDISDLPSLLAHTFESLARRFARVLFVPGNHELWVKRCKTPSSFDKFDLVRRIADDHGVSMAPYAAGSVTVVPLFGWYDYSFASASDRLASRWMDYRLCNWLGQTDEEVTLFFTDMNASSLTLRNETVISFSHFLPRIDAMPERIPVKHRLVYPVLGSNILERQVRTLGSSVHVYGHSHVNRHVKLEGVVYVNNAFGNPNEAHIAAKALFCVYDSDARASV